MPTTSSCAWPRPGNRAGLDERTRERHDREAASPLRHAPHGQSASGQLSRRPRQLGAAAGRLRMLLLRGELACPDHGPGEQQPGAREHRRDGRGLAGGGARSRAKHALHPVARARARRASPALFHGHPAGLARARPHLQGDGRAARARISLVRPPGIPAPAGRGHLDVQGAVGARGRGSGAAHRADPGGRPALQPHVEARGLSGAGREADGDSQGAGHGGRQDVEVARQRHLPVGQPGSDHGQGQAHGHRSRPQAPERSRQSRHLPRLRPAQDLHPCARARGLRHGLPLGRHRLSRLQGGAPRAHDPAPRQDPGSARALRGQAARDRGDPPRGLAPRPRLCPEDHGGGQISDQPRAAMIETEAAPEPQGLTVRVESFVGPLALLLPLSRSNEVDLPPLPIRAITEQYLAHLESVQFQDLETAGAFMVMAATLIYLKSKLLLPPAPDAPPEVLDEEGELLRQALADRLREYARVKALGTWLGEREAEQALLYGRTVAELPPPEGVPLADLSLHLLERAMTRLIQEQKRQAPRQIEPNPLSVLERMGEIVDLLRNTWSILFSSVAGQERVRAEWVVTLLALLELVRLGQARAHQAELFGEIVIEGPTTDAATALGREEPAAGDTTDD